MMKIALNDLSGVCDSTLANQKKEGGEQRAPATEFNCCWARIENMDDLLAEVGGGDSGIGLNIVCDAPAAPATAGLAPGGGPNKRRKKNKYERRRAKARQAREEQERQKLMKFAPKSEEKGTDGPPSAVDNDKAVPAEEDEHTASSDADANAEDDEEDIIAVDQSKREIGSNDDDDNDGNASEDSSPDASEGESEDEDEDDGPAPPSPSASSPATSSVPQKLSRRVHDATLLEDERKRADYMATFHARPHEIDRRSNASGRIKESRASNHIFEADDDEEDDEEEVGSNSHNGNNIEDGAGENDEAMDLDDQQEDKDTAPKCPFEAIGLHPRLANAVSSERGFGYDRPTIIQTNAARALISTNKNGGKKKKPKASSDKLPNLFVQSETGSGKTLAYLLPIVQVCLLLVRFVC